MRPAFHSILVHLATGPLILTFLVVTFRFWFRPREGWLHVVWRACEPVAFYSTLFGLVTITLTFITGFMLRPLEAMLNSPITKNKILMGLLAMVCWYGWMALRLRLKDAIWQRGSFRAHFAYMMCFAGSLFLISTNSVGGDLAGIPSGYEEFASAFGFRTRHALYFPTWINVLLWVSGLAALAAGLYARRSPGGQ
jgi:hypothetical protein